MINKPFRIIAVLATVAVGVCCLLLGAAREPEVIAARRERIAQMGPDEKARLNSLWQRYEALSPAEQKKLGQLEREIGEDEHAAELRDVMRRYYHWSIALPTYQRLELLELPVKQRVAHIGKIKRNAEDAEGLKKWLDAKAGLIIENLPKKQQKQLSVMEPAGKYLMLFRLLSNMSKGAEFKGQEFKGQGAKGRKQLTDQDLADLRSHLSQQTREWLESKPPAEQWKLVVKRLQRHFRGEMAGRRFNRMRGGRRFQGDKTSGISDEELAGLFEKLPLKQQDLLLSLPAEEMRQQLHQFYLQRRFPGPRGQPRNGRRPYPFKARE